MHRCPPLTAVAAPAPNRRPKAAAEIKCYNRRFSAGQDAVMRAVSAAVDSFAVRQPKGTGRASLRLPHFNVRPRALAHRAKVAGSGLEWDDEAQILRSIPVLKTSCSLVMEPLALDPMSASASVSLIPAFYGFDLPTRFINQYLSDGNTYAIDDQAYVCSGSFSSAAHGGDTAPVVQFMTPAPVNIEEADLLPFPPLNFEEADLIPLPGMPEGITPPTPPAHAPSEAPGYLTTVPGAVQQLYSPRGRADSAHIEPIVTVTITQKPAVKPNAALGSIAAALSLASLVAPSPAVPVAMALAGVVGLVQGVRMAIRAARRGRGAVYRSRYLSPRLMSAA